MKDLSGYKLVFFDDFDKGALDMNAWEDRRIGRSGCGYDSMGQVSFDGSLLHIKGKYEPAGEFGPGWYGCSLSVKKRWTKGYYECRCKPGHALNGGLWSAFWIQAEHPYDPKLSRGGRDGAELDIFECWTGTDGVEYFESTIHCAGMEKRLRPSKDLDSLTFVRFVPDNLCSEFHTFGLDWDDDAYTVYMDGVKIASTSWGDGTSSASGEVVLSVCVPGSADFTDDTDYVNDFVVDWVKIWQKD